MTPEADPAVPVALHGVTHRFAPSRTGTRHGARRGARPAEPPALRGVTLRVEPGQTLALLGRNGSGKSTMIRLVAGVLAPGAGSIRVYGADPLRSVAIRRRVGVAFQRASLDPLLTVRENLRLHARLFGLSAQTSERGLAEAADRLGVADRLDQRAGALSGGLLRRADLARALLTEPDLLLLDEATAALDPEARGELLAALNAARAARGGTIIMATHLLDEAERADRVVMMHRGEVVFDADPETWRRLRHRSVLRTRADLPPSASCVERDADGWTTLHADTEAERDRLAGIARQLTATGAAFTFGPPSLDDLFAEIGAAT